MIIAPEKIARLRDELARLNIDDVIEERDYARTIIRNWCVEYRGDYFPFGFRETCEKVISNPRFFEHVCGYTACEDCARGAGANEPVKRKLRPAVIDLVLLGYWRYDKERDGHVFVSSELRDGPVFVEELKSRRRA